MPKSKNFETYFRIFSYLSVLSGFISVWISGTFGFIETIVFISIIFVAWFLDNTKWQLSERLGTILIVAALPIFYIGWRYRIFGQTETMLAGILARLILSLTSIKLLQKKSDRDWIFLYMMSFFEVLLAAGLSISALYLGSFIIYLLLIICTIIAFEMRKTFQKIKNKPKLRINQTLNQENEIFFIKPIQKLPLSALGLIFFIVLLAIPIFFLLPRVSGAGFGGKFDSISTSTGFSESVNLGSIGKIQQNEQVVMRARLEQSPNLSFIRWRGIALDEFDNKNWKRTTVNAKEVLGKDGDNFFRIPPVTGRNNFVVQTIYLEPLDRAVLFSLARPVLLQGNFSEIFRDSENGISFNQRNFERISYKVWSDVTLPDTQKLRTDNNPYSTEFNRYLQIPAKIDARISQLAEQISKDKNNRYDKAKGIEEYLQTQYSYTLDLKAGGDEPLADFLFNVREGHCEYFATAMAIMLRTQGIATRIVNGFQQGEYNETADVYVVRQRNAHSWVEVYFPRENIWVPFDPTPFAGQNLETNSSTGLIGKFNNYVEALETFWIQYFVAYDNQEQRSLMNSVRSGFNDYQAKTSFWFSEKQKEFAEWWTEVRGDKGFASSIWAIGYAIGYIIAGLVGVFIIIKFYRKIVKLQFLRNFLAWLKYKKEARIIEFYQRMQRVLANKGFKRETHQTPLEFAFSLNIPEAVKITEKYNSVRFGEKSLTAVEADEIENWLQSLENKRS